MPHVLAQVHIEDRGFQFADGVYEVFALMNGQLADETGHLDRLERSLNELRISMPMPRRALQMVIRELIRRNRIRNATVYLQISRGTAARDFKFPDLGKPTLVMTMRPASFDITARKDTIKKIVTMPDIRWKRRDIKTTALVAQVLAKQAALDCGADDAWMVDDKGFITEASSSNAWIVDQKGNLVTRPTKGNAILKGVTRNALQVLCKKEKIRLMERAFTPADARKAREAFMSSAVALIVPVGEIDGKKIGSGKIGSLTSKIFDLYMTYASGKRQESWDAA